jgi:hypothetical protein
MTNQLLEGYSAPFKKGILKNKLTGYKKFNERRPVFNVTFNVNFRHILENSNIFLTSAGRKVFMAALLQGQKQFFHSYSFELYLCRKDVPSFSCGYDSEIGHVPHLPVILPFQDTRNKRKSTQRRNWSYGPLSTNRFTGNTTETSFRKQQEGCSPFWYLVLLAVAPFRVIASFRGRIYS